jgi:hypothetical protein
VRRQCYFEDEISLFHFPVDDGYRFELPLAITNSRVALRTPLRLSAGLRHLIRVFN